MHVALRLYAGASSRPRRLHAFHQNTPRRTPHQRGLQRAGDFPQQALPRAGRRAIARREVRPTHADPGHRDQGLAGRPAGPCGAAVKPLLRELVTASRYAANSEIKALLAPLCLPTGLMWGVERVVVEDGRYAPDPAGRPAIIVPVYDEGGIIDLVATGLASKRIAT